MKKISVLLFFLLSICSKKISAQNTEGIVELTGVIMSADSLRYIPFVNIDVNHGQRHATASNLGVFSLLAEMGDTLTFNSMGYRSKEYIIPSNLTEIRYSILQLMVQDTFYLPITILRPGPSKEQFDYAFKNWEIPDDKYEIARKNTEQQYLALISRGLARDGRESQTIAINNIIQRNNWIGQRPPQNIFSPLAWADFIKAWQRGDFKRKKKR